MLTSNTFLRLAGNNVCVAQNNRRAYHQLDASLKTGSLAPGTSKHFRMRSLEKNYAYPHKQEKKQTKRDRSRTHIFCTARKFVMLIPNAIHYRFDTTV